MSNVRNIFWFPAPSRLALGVEDRRIPDGGFSASSSWDRNHGPKRARLNIIKRGRLTGSWSSRVNNRAQWLLIDITKQARVVGFAVQGRQDYNQWVVSLRISHSVGGVRFRYYTERRRAKVCSSALLFYNIDCRRGGGACNHVTHSFTGICEDEVVLVKPSSRILKRKSNLLGNIYSISFMLRIVFLTLL